MLFCLTRTSRSRDGGVRSRGNTRITRHDAVHAIGSVVAEHLFDILKTDQIDDAATSQARYYTAVERLTAASWRKGEH